MSFRHLVLAAALALALLRLLEQRLHLVREQADRLGVPLGPEVPLRVPALQPRGAGGLHGAHGHGALHLRPRHPAVLLQHLDVHLG